MNPLLSCREVLDALGDDLEGSLPRGKSLQVRLHLYLCRHCRNYQRTYRKTTQLVTALKSEANVAHEQPLSDTLIFEIIQRVRLAGPLSQAK